MLLRTACGLCLPSLRKSLLCAMWKRPTLFWDPSNGQCWHGGCPKFKRAAGARAGSCKWRPVAHGSSFTTLRPGKHVKPLLYFKATGGWEPLVQNTLRSGHKRTFAELTLMADYLNVTQPHKNSKKELLKQCQACFGEEFAEACREAAESDNQKAPDADMPDGFVSALLENMEPSEKQDFQDLEKALMRQEQQAERQRWQDMWDEKVAEQRHLGKTFQ